MYPNNFQNIYPGNHFLNNLDTLISAGNDDHVFSSLAGHTTFMHVEYCSNNAIFQTVSTVSSRTYPSSQEQIYLFNDIVFLPVFVSLFVMLNFFSTGFRLKKLWNSYSVFTESRFSLMHVLLILNAVFVLSMFLVLFVKIRPADLSVLFFSYVVLVISGYFLIRWLFVGGVGLLMDNSAISTEYLKYDVEFLLWIGTIFAMFFPFAFVGVLVDYLRLVMLLFLLFLFLFRWYYVFKLGLSEKKYGVLMFFLYFCTVEILPLSVLFKLMGII